MGTTTLVLVSDRSANDFRERARVEADRYGPDPWIFVRELLQNARDAGARSVAFSVEEGPQGTKVRCRDDGEGMSYEHARRYLFSLYASSKEDRANQVGRFGVGFWSILRFEPTRIVIRSRPRPRKNQPAEPGWQVVLDGALQNAERSSHDMEPGTEVLLERPAGDGSDARRVWEAAVQNARFLVQRDDPDVPLPVLVNGRPINSEFSLPAPSSAFRRGHVRGVVGLGSAPRVELFSRGLRVRSAACLDDLLTTSGHTGHSRVRFPELPGGLAPQALLESDGLELLLSRSDARDTRTLRRLVKLGQNELRYLVERQLARIRPPGIGERISGLLRRVAGESTWWRALLGAATGAVLAVLVAQILWPSPRGEGRRAQGSMLTVGSATAGHAVEKQRKRTYYRDLSKRYDGPQVSELDPAGAEPVELRYKPADARPYFAALVIEDVSGAADASAAVTDERYPDKRCSKDCMQIELLLASAPGTLRIPVPTGHRLDVDSVRFVSDATGEPVELGPVWLSEAGEPVLEFERAVEGRLHYTTGPGRVRPPRSGSERPKLELPDELRADVRELRRLPKADRIDAAIELVRSRVRYSTQREVAKQHDRARALGQDFVTRALAIAAGDCDVQNGLLVAILDELGMEARLAVGWVGDAGGVSPWAHAWVEVLDGERWVVADATGRSVGVAGLPTVSRPAPGAEPGATDAAQHDEPPEIAEAPAGEPVTSADEPSPATPAEPAASVRQHLPVGLVAVLEQPWVPWAALASGLLGLGLLGFSFARRTARNYQLDDTSDVSSLLHGALAQPAAFRHLPSLFHRRLIPVRGGAPISLQRARSLASRGRLYVGREQTELSRTARQRGIAVLDGDTPEGRTVAASLAAVDLDRWGHRLARASETPLLQGLAQHLREQGERWRIAAVRSLGDPVATLDLRPLGASRRLGDRLVLVDTDDPFLLETERLRATRPHAAAFALLDHLLDHLDLGPERRATLLAPLAERAVHEAAHARADRGFGAGSGAGPEVLE